MIGYQGGDCAVSRTDDILGRHRAQPGARGRKSDWPATWRNWIRRAQEHHTTAGGAWSAARLPPSTAPQPLAAEQTWRLDRVGLFHRSWPAGRVVSLNMVWDLVVCRDKDRGLAIPVAGRRRLAALTASAAGSSFEVVFDAEAGVAAEPVSACWDRAFEKVPPVRAFPSAEDHVNRPAYRWSVTTG